MRILKQPECQHRARYLTEGSRGSVKDKTGTGFPTVKLEGCVKPVKLQIYVGSEKSGGTCVAQCEYLTIWVPPICITRNKAQHMRTM